MKIRVNTSARFLIAMYGMTTRWWCVNMKGTYAREFRGSILASFLACNQSYDEMWWRMNGMNGRDDDEVFCFEKSDGHFSKTFGFFGLMASCTWFLRRDQYQQSSRATTFELTLSRMNRRIHQWLFSRVSRTLGLESNESIEGVSIEKKKKLKLKKVVYRYRSSIYLW